MTYQTSTRKQVSDVRSVILRTLRDRGPMTSAELEDALRASGVSFTGRVRDRLGELVRRNLVAKTGEVRGQSPVYRSVQETLDTFYGSYPRKAEAFRPADPVNAEPIIVIAEPVVAQPPIKKEKVSTTINIPVNVDFIVGPLLARVLKRLGVE